MSYPRSSKFGPSYTPIFIKLLLLLVFSASVISTILAPFFNANFFQYFLGLSLEGIKSVYFWQFITYNFLQMGYGIDFNFLIVLAFNMYLIWVLGSQVIQMLSSRSYIVFYFASTIFAALVMLLTMLIGYPNQIYSGATIALYATLIAWMMITPKDTKIFLFFAIPIKHYILVLGLIVFNLISNLSNKDLVSFFGYLSVSIFSYFYCVVIWQKRSPFHFLNNFEIKLIQTIWSIRNKLNRKK
jgi:membrane associated rhomboid family serine protease